MHIILVVMTLSAAFTEQDHLIGDQFSAEVFLAGLIFPAACLQTAFDVDLLVLAEVGLADFREGSPGDDVEPFGFFSPFAFRGRPGTGGRNAETVHRPVAGISDGRRWRRQD